MCILAAISDNAYYYIGVAVVLLCVVVAAVVAYRSWEEAHEDLNPATPEDLLESFEQARAEGELDEEEYRRVRQRLQEGGKRDK